MTTTAEKIAVMQAFERGEKVEYSDGCGRWYEVSDPSWDWLEYEYRVAAKPIDLVEALKQITVFSSSHGYTMDQLIERAKELQG